MLDENPERYGLDVVSIQLISPASGNQQDSG